MSKILFNVSEFFLCGTMVSILFYTPLFFNYKTFCEYPFGFIIWGISTLFFGSIHFYFQLRSKNISLRRIYLPAAICWVVFFIVFFVNWMITENLELRRNRELLVILPSALVFYCYLAGSLNFRKFFIYHVLINTLVVYTISTHQLVTNNRVMMTTIQVCRGYLFHLLPLSTMFFFFCHHYTQKIFHKRIYIFFLMWLVVLFSVTEVSQVTFLGLCVLSFIFMAGLRFFKLSGYGKLACVSLLIILSIVVHNQLKSNSLLKDKLEVRIAKNSTSKQCMALLQQARMLDVGFEVFNKIQKASDLAARCDIRKAYCTYAAACFICNPFGVGFGIGNFPNAMGFCPYLLLSGGIWLTLPVLLSIIFSYFSQKPNYMAMRFTG